MKFWKWILGSKESYYDQLDALLKERHRYQAILEHIKNQLDENSNKLEWSDEDFNKEWGKYYGVEPVILDSHYPEYKRGLKEIDLVRRGRGIMKKLHDLDEQISGLIHKMMGLGLIH